jgi:hypothetical protein
LVGLVCAATLAAVIGGTGTTTWIRHASTAMPSIAGTVQADAGGQHPVPSAPISIAVGAPGQSTASATAPASPVVAASGVAFEVLVPSDQAIALRRLLTAMASRHTVIPAGTTMTDAETGELLEPELIGIIRLPDIAPLGKHDDERGRERR